MATRQNTLFVMLLLALALALSTMTAFRLPGLPVGISELILMGCMIAHLPLGLGLHGDNHPNRFMPFMFLFVVLTLPGFFITLMVTGLIPEALRDLIAYVWVLIVIAYLHFGFDHQRFEIHNLANLFVLFSTGYFIAVLVLLQLAPEMVYLQDDITELMENTSATGQEEVVFRLVGFSTNPNQLTFHALVVVFVAWTLVDRNGWMRTVVYAGIGTTVGIMAKSDAFLFSLIAFGGIALVMGIWFGRSVILGLLVLVPAATVVLVNLPLIVRRVQDIASTSGQDATRFTLWDNGMAAALQKPWTGHGPGPWSGFDGPLGLEESHNSLVDYFAQAGSAGLVLAVIGILFLIFRSLVARRAVLLAGTTAILLYAMFHNVLRQPIFWFSLYYVAQQVWPGAVATSKRRKRRRVRTSRGLPV